MGTNLITESGLSNTISTPWIPIVLLNPLTGPFARFQGPVCCGVAGQLTPAPRHRDQHRGLTPTIAFVTNSNPHICRTADTVTARHSLYGVLARFSQYGVLVCNTTNYMAFHFLAIQACFSFPGPPNLFICLLYTSPSPRDS